MWAALRHRRGQAIALALVSALVATCAVFAPVFARSIDQGLLRAHLTESDPARTATSIARTRTRTADEGEVLPAEVAREVPPELAAVSEEPLQVMRQSTRMVPAKGKQPSPVILRSRTGVCDHLKISGRCPKAAGEVVVSAADATAWKWHEGTELEIPEDTYPGRYPNVDAEPPPIELTVVGTYTVSDDPGYWLGDRPDGKSGVSTPDLENLPMIDDVFTPEATFDGALPKATAMVLLPLDARAATLDSLPEAAAAGRTLEEKHPELDIDDAAAVLVDDISTGRSQTAVIVPFVTVQLALLSVLVLFLVAQAAVDGRRHDVALARLRGRSRSGARRMLLTDLTIPVLIGLPFGFSAALGLALLLRWIILPAGIPFEVPLTALWWLVGALVASIAAVGLAARPVLREPVNDLLRSVQSTSGGGSRVTETVVMVLALLGVVGLASGALEGPAALATPTLLAIAVGLLAARVVPALAARRAARAMRRGRVAAAVAGHAIARRPAGRRILVVTTVAAAVAVFGANAVVVADHNRQARAELETGAPAVVTVDAQTGPALLEASTTLREAGIDAAAVAVIRPREEDAETTMAVDPDHFTQVAHPSAVAGLDLAPLALPTQQPIVLAKGAMTARVEWDLTRQQGDEPPELVADLTTRTGESRSVVLATLGPRRSGDASVDEELFCTGCRLAGLRVSTSGLGGSSVAGTVTIADLSVDGTALPVTDEGTWISTREGTGTGITTTTQGDSLRLEVTAADGADVSTWVSDVPRPVPAITSTGVKVGSEQQVVDIAGGQTQVRVAADVTQLPSVTDRGVLLSLPGLSRVTGELDVTRTQRQLWLADASPATLDRIDRLLAESGVHVQSVATTAEAKAAYDRSASGWGLQLALVGGALAVLLAGLVLIILSVTGWRSTARDLAALRVSGVARRDIARALRSEHLVTVAVGVILGAGCALVGSWIALPSIPLFTAPADVPLADLAPAWPMVAISALLVGLVLLALAGFLAGSVLRRVRLGAARGEAS